jgi:predicted transcriptional regulator
MVVTLVFLACLLYLAIATNGSGSAEWQLQVAGPVDYMSIGSGNVLYAFSGNNITVISPGGQIKWTAGVPDCMVLADRYNSIWPALAEDQGNLYLYVVNNSSYNRGDGSASANGIWMTSRDVLAFSHSGRLLWDYPMTGQTDPWTDYRSIRAADGRVYVYQNNREIVLDSSGNVLLDIGNIFGPPVIDEAGDLYVVPMGDNTAYSRHYDNYTGSFDDLLPSRIIEAYSPGGKLLWSKDIGDYVHRSQEQSSQYVPTDVPLYRNGTIYLLAGHKFLALDTGGNELWSYDFGSDDIRISPFMPLDGAGNLFVEAGNGSARSYPLTYAVNIDSRKVREVTIPSSINSYAYIGRVHLDNHLIEGICYQVNTTDVIDVQPIAWSQFSYDSGIKDLTDINALSVTATDLLAGRTLWTFTVPDRDARTDIINGSNVGLIFPPDYLAWIYASGYNLSTWSSSRLFVDRNDTPINSWSTVDVLPGYKVTYLVVNNVNYEPVVYNQSLCHHINGIYALNETGQILWFRPADARIEQTAAGNGTIYYTTGGGKIFAGGNGVVSGVAVLAMAYVFLRFFMIGAVSRARSRLDRNENRNLVYRYIADNPGLTLYDISRDLHMNVGTARYHLMILGINHRIVTGKAFGKYARYFTNSGSHSLDEQLLFSALRRQGIKNILGLLVERPGLSNREIAGELRMRESAASRYMKELTSIGLVERRNRVEGRHEYYINGQYEEALATTMNSNAGKMF